MVSPLVWQSGLCVGMVLLAVLAAWWTFLSKGSAQSWFEWENYFPLRDQGLTHKQAIAELERMWESRAT